MRIGLISGLGLAAGGISARSVHAQQFSAEIQRTDAASQAPRMIGTLNVADEKVRIQTLDVPTGFFIVRGDSNAAYFVRPGMRTFMDAGKSSQLTQVFVRVDPNNPCQKWQAMTENAGGASPGTSMQCERVETVSVHGREATKYHVLSTQGWWYFAWIDQTLRFVLKYQVDDGTTFAIVNIAEIAQPESLFEIPDDYQKFDPRRLIDRIKQSDVWVEPIQ
jgi:hypothetical protein